MYCLASVHLHSDTPRKKWPHNRSTSAKVICLKQVNVGSFCVAKFHNSKFFALRKFCPGVDLSGLRRTAQRSNCCLLYIYRRRVSLPFSGGKLYTHRNFEWRGYAPNWTFLRNAAVFCTFAQENSAAARRIYRWHATYGISVIHLNIPESIGIYLNIS